MYIVIISIVLLIVILWFIIRAIYQRPRHHNRICSHQEDPKGSKKNKEEVSRARDMVVKADSNQYLQNNLRNQGSISTLIGEDQESANWSDTVTNNINSAKSSVSLVNPVYFPNDTNRPTLNQHNNKVVANTIEENQLSNIGSTAKDSYTPSSITTIDNQQDPRSVVGSYQINPSILSVSNGTDYHDDLADYHNSSFNTDLNQGYETLYSTINENNLGTQTELVNLQAQAIQPDYQDVESIVALNDSLTSTKAKSNNSTLIDNGAYKLLDITRANASNENDNYNSTVNDEDLDELEAFERYRNANDFISAEESYFSKEQVIQGTYKADQEFQDLQIQSSSLNSAKILETDNLSLSAQAKAWIKDFDQNLMDNLNFDEQFKQLFNANLEDQQALNSVDRQQFDPLEQESTSGNANFLSDFVQATDNSNSELPAMSNSVDSTQATLESLSKLTSDPASSPQAVDEQQAWLQQLASMLKDNPEAMNFLNSLNQHSNDISSSNYQTKEETLDKNNLLAPAATISSNFLQQDSPFYLTDAPMPYIETDPNILHLSSLFEHNAANYIVFKLVPIRSKEFSSDSLINFLNRYKNDFKIDMDNFSYVCIYQNNTPKPVVLYNLFTDHGQLIKENTTSDYQHLVIFVSKRIFSLGNDLFLSTLLSRLHSISVDLKGEFYINGHKLGKGSLSSPSTTFRKNIGDLLRVDFTADPKTWLVK